MAQRNALEKPQRKAKILELVLAGHSDSEVAAAVSTPKSPVCRQAITAWRHRHPELLKPAEAQLIEQATTYAIADKMARLADLQWLRDRIAEMANMSGLVGKEVKIASNGDTAEEDYFDEALVKQWRGVLDDAASEMLHRGRGKSDTNVNVGVQVLIREFHGAEVELG